MRATGKALARELEARPDGVGAGGYDMATPAVTQPLDEARATGPQIFDLARDIFSICRSITGDGVRATLQSLGRFIDIDVHEVASGTPAFDWTVPREWTIRDAYIKDAAGQRVVDFKANNLHVMSYSAPVSRRMTRAELAPHLHTLTDQPDLIPYRTSYYAETWGFCLSHNQAAHLPDVVYDVRIDSSFRDGSLTYGEMLLPGALQDEVLLSAHICHPSLANDNCSGLALLTRLAEWLGRRKTKLSYRFIFAPGTIGAIAWLSRNEARAARIKHGLIVSCVGDGGGPNYKRSRRGEALIDRAMAHVLAHCGLDAKVSDFSPYGYDERQYCSPGFNLPVGLFQRSQWGAFPEYHTSADNLDFIRPQHLERSFELIIAAIEILENDRILTNTSPKCEPQLGKRGLYNSVGGDKDAAAGNMAMLWTLNLSDGEHSLLDIAERSKTPFATVLKAAKALLAAGLLRET